MSMKYISMELGPIMTNCYIVYDTDTKEAMVVDPAWDYPAIDKALTSHGLTLKFIFLTHGHADHIGALQELRQRKNVPVYVGAGDADLISNSHNNLSLFMGQAIECTSADHLVKDGDELTLGHLHFTAWKRRAIRRAASACTVKASSFPATRCSAIPSAVPTSTAARRRRCSTAWKRNS